MESAFLLLLQPKGLCLGDDHKLHKELKARELQEELQALIQPLGVSDDNVSIVSKEGGTVAALNNKVVCAQVGDRIAVFQGQLRNLEKLSTKYGPYAASRPLSPTECSRTSSVNGDASLDSAHEDPIAAHTTTTEDGHQLNAAEMVLHMYEALGVAMLAQLVGRFSVCMYDAKQMRVLAARDGSGSVPLIQARTAKDCLAISTNPKLLEGCHDILEFSPGFFKYGWHAEPRLFTAQDAATPRRSIDQGYSGSCNRRNSLDTHGHSNGSRRSSMDAHGHAGSRRGSIDAHGNGNGSRRTSMDKNDTSHRRSLDGGLKPRNSHVHSPPNLPPVEEKNEEGGQGQKHTSHKRHTHPSHTHQNGNHANGSHKGAAASAKAAAALKDAGAVHDAAHALSHLNVNAKVFVPGGAAPAVHT